MDSLQFTSALMTNPTPTLREMRAIMTAAERSGRPSVLNKLRGLSDDDNPIDTAAALRYYIGCIYKVTNLIVHKGPGDLVDFHLISETEVANFVYATMRMKGSPRYFTPRVIDELWVQFVRNVPTCQAAQLGVGMLFAAENLAELPATAATTVLRVLGEQLTMPWVENDTRDAICAAIYPLATASYDPKAFADPACHATLVQRLQASCLSYPIIRLVSQPLLEPLTAMARYEVDSNKNSFLLLLALAVGAALKGELAGVDAAGFLHDVEAAVLAHSPFIFEALHRFTLTWPEVKEGRPESCAAYTFPLLAAISPQTYQAALDAGGKRLVQDMDALFCDILGKSEAGELSLDDQAPFSRYFEDAARFPSDHLTNFVDGAMPIFCAQLEPNGKAFGDAGEELFVEQAEKAARVMFYTPYAESFIGKTMPPEIKHWLEVEKREEERHVCAGCGERKAKTLICSGCGLRRYCSTACQHADWRRHKPECKAAQQLAS